MQASLRPSVRSIPLLALASALVPFIGACSPSHAADSSPAPAQAGADVPSGAPEDAPVTDAPLSEARGRLLELAFDSASAMPLKPHIKSRSRAQEAVVAACLELDQPQRALRYAERIADWRRGTGCADVAFHCAQKGARSEAARCLALATQVVTELERTSEGDEDVEENTQAWRKDRVRAKIARTHLLLGQEAEAGRFTQGLESSETGPVALAAAMRVEADAFDSHLRALEADVATGDFDRLRSALAAYAQLYGRFYADSAKRARLEECIERASKNVPITVRVENRIELAEAALGHADPAQALTLVAQARALLASSRWATATHVPFGARLAAVRFRAGEEAEGRKDLEEARARFVAEREAMVDIYRAGVLRPLAEAYLAVGERATARELYAQAVEAGVVNPNSRPRSEDLTATCCSMAVHGFEPDEALWARLTAVRTALSEPW